MKRNNKIIAVLLCLSMILVLSPPTVFAGIENNEEDTKASAVCAIGNQGYDSIQEALDAAADGDTVTLLASLEVTEQFIVKIV